MLALMALRGPGNLKTKQREHVGNTVGFAECETLCRAWEKLSFFTEEHMEWFEMLSLVCHSALYCN